MWILFAVLRTRVGRDAALAMQLLSGCGRALRSGSHGCSLGSSWQEGDGYVSKALVGIILDAFTHYFGQTRRASVLPAASHRICPRQERCGPPRGVQAEGVILKIGPTLRARPLQLEILTARAVKI